MKQKAFKLIFRDSVTNEVVFERFPADGNMAHSCIALVGSDLTLEISLLDYEPAKAVDMNS